MPSFILASQSPRRKTLLEWAEIPFEIIVSDIDESYPSSLAIEEVPVYIAKNKALAVKEIILSTKPALVNQCIIAADTFHVLTAEQIEFYVDKYKPYDKAGGYAIQEWIGVVGIKKITGDFYNVMGLPVSKLVQTIKQLDIS